jgi:hypothetical protein
MILLMLGTHDVNQGYDPGGPGYRGRQGFAADAAQRLDVLVCRLLKARPGLILVISAIIPLGEPAKDAKARAYDAFIPLIAAAHRKLGQEVRVADMYAALTPRDLSPDGVHPGTLGYDKMARVLYRALTGDTPPPLPAAPVPSHGPGRLAERNVFSAGTSVAVSNSFASAAHSGGNLVDGTRRAFVFGDAAAERVALGGFHGPISRLRFFDAPSYTGRTPASVTIYYSASTRPSLETGDYTKLGTFPLPVVGDEYENPTRPPEHPDAGEPASHPGATIGFCDLDGLSIPADAQSLLLDFSKGGGDADGLKEIQAFRPKVPSTRRS